MESNIHQRKKLNWRIVAYDISPIDREDIVIITFHVLLMLKNGCNEIDKTRDIKFLFILSSLIYICLIQRILLWHEFFYFGDVDSNIYGFVTWIQMSTVHLPLVYKKQLKL